MRPASASAVDVLIPARDEACTIGAVVRGVPRAIVRRVIVIDNGSRDDTAGRARDAGAVVVAAPAAGYGNACLAALAWMRADDPDDDPVLAFMVGDGSDDPRDIPRVTDPVLAGHADLVIGSRARGLIEPGAMPPWQRAGSLFAAAVLTARFGATVTDLGPFRAIRKSALDALGMRDPTYGWTLEMQIKAARAGLRITEVPVAWRRRRGGTPKVAGTLRGTLGATRMILAWLNGAVRGPDHDPVR
ncbi:MAG: glycosyltransferase family 2 protein [Myxococcaceae bacterium]|nr:MAG: glycosyltransferase family 2 protein [Myxococcaceae bacterium]